MACHDLQILRLIAVEEGTVASPGTPDAKNPMNPVQAAKFLKMLW